MTAAEFEDLKKDLRLFGGLKLILGGQSMSPLINDREEISFVPVESRQIRKFDIVAFFSDSSLVCHYVSEVKADQCICKALNFPGEDVVAYESVLGKVSSHRLSWWRRLILTALN